MDFVVGGLAGVGAGLFSNPFDVVKTRMQLQGELRAKGQHAVHYRNIPHAMYTIVKHDGISALQKGLVPALWFQLVVNGVRLGIYQQADNFGLLRDDDGNTKLANSLLFGAIAGMMGAAFGSPLQLVKTQLMSYSSGGKKYEGNADAFHTLANICPQMSYLVILDLSLPESLPEVLSNVHRLVEFLEELDYTEKIAVGTQHAHTGMWFALRRIYAHSGVRGLWRGAHGMMIRNSIGSASQIAAYAICKEWMDANDKFQQSRYLSAFVASNIGAAVKTVALTPMDVIMTRLYNQAVDSRGKGVLYSGIIDCARKITSTEGLLAFYKGMGPSYLRQAPHTVLLLVFWDMLKDLQKSFQEKAKL